MESAHQTATNVGVDAIDEEILSHSDALVASASAAVVSDAAAAAHMSMPASAYIRRVLLEGDGDDSGQRRGRGAHGRGKGKGKGGRRSGGTQAQQHAAVGAHLVSSAGRRKTQRWLNDWLLRDLAGPLDVHDVTALYAPPPWGERTYRPVLERLTEVHGATSQRLHSSLWQLILSPDMDVRDKILRGSSKGKGEAAHDSTATLAAAAVHAWRRLPVASRDALRRAADWPLLPALEEKLVALKWAHIEAQQKQQDLGNCDSADTEAETSGLHHHAACVAGGGDGSGLTASQGQPQMLLFAMDDSFARLLLHSLCQFHALPSASLTANEALHVCRTRADVAVAEIESGGSSSSGVDMDMHMALLSTAEKVVAVSVPCSGLSNTPLVRLASVLPVAAAAAAATATTGSCAADAIAAVTISLR